MRHLPILICLLISFELSNTQPTQSPGHQIAKVNAKQLSKDTSSHAPETVKVGDGNKGHLTRAESRKEENLGRQVTESEHKLGGSAGEESAAARGETSRELTLDHGDAEDSDQDEGIEGEEVSPDDDWDDDDKDEVLEVNYHLPEGKPWKEERYTSDWLYSMKNPSLTAEVHWHCPFYIDEGEKDPEKKRKRGNDAECVTVAQLKYWHTHLGSSTDVLLGKFRITYVPTYVLLKQNALKFIIPRKVEENKVTVDIALNYHSDKLTCERLIYEVQDHGQVKVTKGDKPECKKGEALTTSEWVWEADDDDEDADFKYEAQFEEKDQDEEEEDHVTSPHEYNHGRNHNHGESSGSQHGPVEIVEDGGKAVPVEGRQESIGSKGGASS